MSISDRPMLDAETKRRVGVLGTAALRAAAAYAARGVGLSVSMGLRPRLSAAAASRLHSNPRAGAQGLIAKKIPSVLRIVVLGRTAYMAPGRRPGGFFWGGLPGAGGAGRTVAYLKQHLSSSDVKPVQKIERKEVGEELTTCGGYPGRTRSHTLQFPAFGIGVEHESIPV